MISRERLERVFAGQTPDRTPKAIRRKVRHAIDVCRGKAHLVLFTANTINPDIPLANIKAMYAEALSPGPARHEKRRQVMAR